MSLQEDTLYFRLVDPNDPADRASLLEHQRRVQEAIDRMRLDPKPSAAVRRALASSDARRGETRPVLERIADAVARLKAGRRQPNWVLERIALAEARLAAARKRG